MNNTTSSVTDSLFEQLGLAKELVQATKQQGYTTATAIQSQAIPIVLKGHDLLAAAQTGTGKTAGFILPILHLLNKGKPAQGNQVRTLVLTPTRELAAQVGESAKNYGKNLNLKSNIVFGGVKINPQMMKLRGGSDILVATPGRLLDLYSQNAVRFDQLEILVLDEADRMLDMGFIHDIKKIIAYLPKKRQTLLFSATFSNEIRLLAKNVVHNAREVSVSPPNAAANTVTQWLVPVDKKQKTELLIHLIQEHNWHQVLVFSRTKHGANKIAKKLEDANIKACAIHGNKSQGARTRALADFKSLKVQVMVATDIAARGLDITDLPQVVNFDLPNVPEDYVHRIGRTGRAGASGQAVSLVSADEFKQLADIERVIRKQIERKLVDGFEPSHDLPQSRLSTKPFHAKKPKVKTGSKHHSKKAGGHARGGSRTSNANPNSSSGNKSANKRPSSRGGKPQNAARKTFANKK